MWIRLWTISTIAALLLGGVGCERQAAGTIDRYPYRIVTTVGMVTDIVRQVAGDKADVHGLLGEGVDPHAYKPTRDDMVALMRADVIFCGGLMLEGKMGQALDRLGQTGKRVIAVAERLDPQYLLHVSGSHADPHVWMDVAAWGRAVEVVADALALADPPNASYYRANAQAYAKRLKALDDYARESLASIPDQSRVLVTAHDAFGYFGRAYGVDVYGIQGISTESEAGLRDLRKLIDLIVKRNVRAVFVESSVSQKNVQALLEGARARGHDLRIGGELFSDAMGPAGTYEGTYIGMIDHNVTTIVRALGGTAPERGMNGLLSHAQH